MKTKSVFIVVGLIFGFIASGGATNGYFTHGFGTQYKAMAGAGSALSLNAFAPATNPAGLAYVGKRVDVAFSIFNPNRQYTVTGNPSMNPGTFGLAPGTVESDSKIFLVPSLGASFSLPGGHNFGLVVYGNGGMNTNYPAKTFGFEPTGVNLMQLFVGATYAREIIPNHAIGFTGIFSFQQFKAEGLKAFGDFSSDATKLSDNDNSSSTGFGFRVGYQGKLLPILTVGASYQSKISMSKFEEYAGLFAEQGKFDIPATWNVGVAVHATPLITVALDMQQIMYSDIKAVANPMDLTANSPMLPDGSPNPNFKPLGHEDGWGFGWEDMTVYKLGVQWKAIPGLTFRAGYSLTEQPIPESEVMFNILAPGVIENHATFGFSKTLLPTLQLHFALTRAFSNSVTGANPMEVPGQQQIELKMDQWDVEVGLSFSL
ncbi:MAG: hypothetical protein Kow0042_30270 [Calditrichia bacterium]